MLVLCCLDFKKWEVLVLLKEEAKLGEKMQIAAGTSSISTEFSM